MCLVNVLSLINVSSANHTNALKGGHILHHTLSSRSSLLWITVMSRKEQLHLQSTFKQTKLLTLNKEQHKCVSITDKYKTIKQELIKLSLILTQKCHWL